MMSQRKVVPAYVACALGSLLLFAGLAVEIKSGAMGGLDESVRDFVHHSASPHMAAAMQGVTLFGSVLFVFVTFGICFALFWWAKWRESAWVLAWVMGGSVILDNALKYGFQRARPVPFFGLVPNSYSFPSGHALFSFCLYVALAGIAVQRVSSAWVRGLIWVFAAGLIALVGISRIYLGVHYPSDVFGGYLAGAGWVSAVAAAGLFRVAPVAGRNSPGSQRGDVN